MKKILFIHNSLAYYRIPLFKKLSKNYDITYLITRENQKKTKVCEDLKCELLNHMNLFSKYGFAFAVPFKLLSKKTDIIITNDQHVLETYIAFFAAKLRRKKFIIWSETFDWSRAPRSKIIEPFIKFMIKHTDACIAVGKKSKEYFQKLGAKEGNIFIAPDIALTYEVLNFEKNMEKLNQKVDLKGKKLILYMSRIVPYKGLDFLVKAFAKLEKEVQDVVLLIGGEGSFKKEVEKIVQDLSIKNIEFIGLVKKDEIGFFYSICDVFVLPSLFRDYDADCWGLVLNEAMALGKPLISTDEVGGAHDLIRNGENGYMVKAGNVEELYKALKKIIKNDKLRKKMGKRSKEIIQTEFNYDKMFDGFKKAIEK